MDTILTLTHATERDVDILLIEELKCSPAFVRWFSGLVAAKTNTTIVCKTSSVVHSKRRIHNRREIDITLSVHGDGKRIVLLVENKLDTSEQPFQAESYRSEAGSLISHDEADAVFTVLVAPEAYAATASTFSSKFDCLVTYEAIARFMDERAQKERGELKDRLRHRHDLIQQAITKARRGYQPVRWSRSRHSTSSTWLC
jgi:hypothetical protein